MLDAQFYIASTLFVLSMDITPGPNNLFLMAVGLSHDFRSALPHCIAVGIGQAGQLLAIAFGLGSFFSHFPSTLIGLRFVGATYILWLAWKVSGLGSRKKKDASLKTNTTAKNGTVQPLKFWQAIAFQLVNPKAWLTVIVAYTAYIASGDIAPRLTYLLGVFLCLGFATAATWAAGASFLQRFLTSERIKTVNYILALLLVASVALLFI